jgi:hypothetical protein
MTLHDPAHISLGWHGCLCAFDAFNNVCGLEAVYVSAQTVWLQAGRPSYAHRASIQGCLGHLTAADDLLVTG